MEFVYDDFGNIFELLNTIKESMADFFSFLPGALGAALFAALGTIILIRVFK